MCISQKKSRTIFEKHLPTFFFRKNVTGLHYVHGVTSLYSCPVAKFARYCIDVREKKIPDSKFLQAIFLSRRFSI